MRYLIIFILLVGCTKIDRSESAPDTRDNKGQLYEYICIDSIVYIRKIYTASFTTKLDKNSKVMQCEGNLHVR